MMDTNLEKMKSCGKTEKLGKIPATPRKKPIHRTPDFPQYFGGKMLLRPPSSNFHSLRHWFQIKQAR